MLRRHRQQRHRPMDSRASRGRGVLHADGDLPRRRQLPRQQHVGAGWAGANALSGGPAPRSFKGFAGAVSSRPPACGDTYTARPGNSGHPPGSVPSFMAVAVSSSVTKSGPTIKGDVTHIVIVQTDPGYAPDPGHAGTGTVVAQL